ncbi:MAG TPA: ABC transporter permease [Candidatus Limnocylindria bacterium]|jgi:ABC-2 type transport system permease protein
MAGRVEIFWHLFVASAKTFLRDRTAVFFSFFLPLVIMLIFGVLNFGAAAELEVGVVDEAGTASSQGVITAFGQVPILTITEGSREDELAALEEGDRALVVVFPEGWELIPPGSDGFQPLTAFTNEATAQEGQTALLVVNAVVAQALVTAGGGSPEPLVVVEEVAGRDLGYIDFLVPGILGLTIMQLGLFSVAFGFVQLKTTGTLRRLFATPTSPNYFLGAQVSSRLLITIVQVLILLGVGIWFGVQLVGSIFVVLALSIVGSIVFLAMGFGVAGWAKNENQAAPVANLISLPMMFLSGSFFPREAMPEFLQQVTRFLPLTYLNDALRAVINDGAGLDVIGPDIIGLAVWAVISFVIATRLFKWE